MAVGSGPSRGASGGGYSGYNYKTVPGSNSVGNWNTGGQNYGYGNQNGITRYNQPKGLAGLPSPMGGYEPPRQVKPGKPMKPIQPVPPQVLNPLPGQVLNPIPGQVINPMPGTLINPAGGYSNPATYRHASEGGGSAGMGRLGGWGRGTPGGRGW